jgi:hypothetical protein
MQTIIAWAALDPDSTEWNGSNAPHNQYFKENVGRSFFKSIFVGPVQFDAKQTSLDGVVGSV